MIETRRVLRFYAPYVSSSGARRMRGFGTAKAAARFVAKQELFDLVFGPKVEKDVVVSQGGFTYSVWLRNTPESAHDRAAMFAQKFPLEMCPDSFYYGCERFGYCRCSTKAWMEARVAAILKDKNS